MASWFEVVESKHEFQNPTSRDKILLLGERLGLGRDSHVLDVGSGRGGPAVLLAQRSGCRFTCLERSDVFLRAARQRVKEAGLDDRVQLEVLDASEYAIPREMFDSALCLGASFIWDGLEPTVAALAPGVRDGGFVAVGEPYWRVWPLPPDFDPGEDYDFVDLPESVARFETAGVELVSLIASDVDDWDRYVSLQWLALEDWLHENADHPDAEKFRDLGSCERDAYLRWQRDLLGWAIFVGRKRAA